MLTRLLGYYLLGVVRVIEWVITGGDKDDNV